MVVTKPERDEYLTPFAKETLKDRYLLEGETPQDGLLRTAVAFSDDEAMAQRIYDYASKQWLSFATPVFSNAPIRRDFGDRFETNFTPDKFNPARGLPISCFLNYVPDSREGLGNHYTENIWLGSSGGGIGGYWGHIRSDGTKTSQGSKSTGSIPFLKIVDSEMLAVSQGVTRRGSYAAWYDISHPEILEFLDIRKPTGGDVNRKALNLHHGVCIPNKFMRIIEECSEDSNASPDWELIDPHSKEVTDVVDARLLWQKIIETRAQTGEPFIAFIDTINEAFPDELKEDGLRVHHSNLCSEITLATNENKTAVCCLSSLNLEKWEEWCDDECFIGDVIRFLDNVLEYFILNAPMSMQRAILSAMEERSLGLGALGWHYLLMSKNLPFESALASSLNRKIFKHIHDHAQAATLELGEERGEAPLLEGTGRRNAHLLAIAPNASSSILLGTSPSIEPIAANIYTHKTLSGSWTVKNKYLDEYIQEHFDNEDYNDIWKAILQNGGSIQGLPYFDEWTQSVFQTAFEIDQRWVVDHAAVRQKYICQSQSLNLFFEPNVPVSYIHGLLLQGWKRGVKTFYYQRTKALRRAEMVSTKVERRYLVDDGGGCISCEG
jgi:ribonucleoside-diphosphate reductase alpha chain